MQIENWPIDEALLAELEKHYRTQFALAIKDASPIEIAHAVTFDHVAPDVTFEDAVTVLRLINAYAKGAFHGTLVELGAGCGFFSAALAALPTVERVYAVDACANLVKELMPKVVPAFIGENGAERVIGCIGEFERIALPDGSVDAIFDFYSLHHAPDLARACREMWRVLKPGGAVVCLDKARADRLSDAELDALLDVEYSQETKRNMGIAPEIRQTRRMNGEREYRRRDWDRMFRSAGFRSFDCIHLARVNSSNPVVSTIKRLAASLPIRFQESLFRSISVREVNHQQSSPIAFVRGLAHFPKEPNLMVARK